MANLRRRAHKGVDRVMNRAESMRVGGKRKLANVRRGAHKGVNRVMNRAESMRDRGEEGLAYLEDHAMMMKGNVDGYIRKNPERSVLIAAGIGALVGAMFAAAILKRR